MIINKNDLVKVYPIDYPVEKILEEHRKECFKSKIEWEKEMVKQQRKSLYDRR